MDRRFLAIVAFLFAATLRADEPVVGYQKAPDAVRRVLDAPPSPIGSLSPSGKHLLLAESQRYPSIAELARPSLKLAGLRIDPRTNGSHGARGLTALSFIALDGGKSVRLTAEKGAVFSAPTWSPDGDQFAVRIVTDKGSFLHVGEPGSSNLTKVSQHPINASLGTPVRWVDNTTLLIRAIPVPRGPHPVRPETPAAPVIQESSGKAGPVRTFQDLLKTPHDEALLDYYTTAQLRLVSLKGGDTPLGKPGVFADCQPSPDGKHFLVERYHRPYSYLHPLPAFPRTVEVWDSKGNAVKIADLPLADRVPIEGVTTGPRGFQWRPTAPATLIWVEALDGGDPRKKATHRDQLFTLAAPFTGKPVPLTRTQHRFAGLSFGDKGFALLSDFERNKKRKRVFQFDLDNPNAEPKLVWDLSIQDRYAHPGDPLYRRLPTGQRVMRKNGDDLFLEGNGASPEGDRPFLDRFNLATGKATRLFHCAKGEYESVVALLDEDGSRFLTRHETPTSPPNYRIRQVGKDPIALTDFKDPAPELRKITRRKVVYKRHDGVQLSFSLVLPPDYKEGTRLPALVWAYPREFNDAATAGQITGSESRFSLPGGSSHLFFALAGYAVLDEATMPVVGSPEKANDNFVEQIVANAKAAIDKADELGVIDRKRVGVGGHSYGAFMTANLLAHSDLFRAGIARSGAYNRTLTPFGFQNERRTFWQAPEVYLKMSPFMHADKIKTPILLIHGADDNNPGTFPLQSDRLYQAIRGNGGTVRYVSLPHESHGYQARESVEHTIAEMLGWFDRHVRPTGP